MTVDLDALSGEWKALRRGRATRHPAIVRRVGPQIRLLCGITGEDTASVARKKIGYTIESLLREEEPQTLLAVTAALALHRETDHRDLADRERWLAGQLQCHERTARRRVDDAFEVLIGHSVEGVEATVTRPDTNGWYVRGIRSVLRLDGGTPELTEHRTIQFTGISTDELLYQFSLPKAIPSDDSPHELIAEVIYGGRIRGQDRPVPEHFRYFIELPRAYVAGETHDYAMRFRIPPRQLLAPHFVLQPLSMCEAFDLTVRFDTAKMPESIWCVDGVPPRMVDVSSTQDVRLTANRFGEVRLEFGHPRQGLAYGLRWSYGASG